MAENRPRGRVKNVTNNSKGVKKRGSGLGTGPVGSGGGYTGAADGSSSGRSTRASSGSKGSLIKIILLVVVLLCGGGGIGGVPDLRSYFPRKDPIQKSSSGFFHLQK